MATSGSISTDQPVMHGEFSGELHFGVAGEAGGYYIPSISRVDDTTVNISFAASKDGMAAVQEKSITLPRGLQGEPGKDGEDGKDGTSVTVISVTESSEDGGNNVVTFSDGNKLTVKNGKTGAQGEQGIQGDPGPTGAAGVDGSDYVLTEADKTEIAGIAAGLVNVPEGSGGVNVSGATPGQMIIVKSVDENGKPTEWEAVDAPSSGNENADTLFVNVEENFFGELQADITLEDAIAYMRAGRTVYIFYAYCYYRAELSEAFHIVAHRTSVVSGKLNVALLGWSESGIVQNYFEAVASET